jgi:hypothetical protein
MDQVAHVSMQRNHAAAATRVFNGFANFCKRELAAAHGSASASTISHIGGEALFIRSKLEDRYSKNDTMNAEKRALCV